MPPVYFCPSPNEVSCLNQRCNWEWFVNHPLVKRKLPVLLPPPWKEKGRWRLTWDGGCLSLELQTIVIVIGARQSSGQREKGGRGRKSRTLPYIATITCNTVAPGGDGNSMGRTFSKKRYYCSAIDSGYNPIVWGCHLLMSFSYQRS